MIEMREHENRFADNVRGDGAAKMSALYEKLWCQEAMNELVTLIEETEAGFSAMRTKSLNRLRRREGTVYQTAEDEAAALIGELTVGITEQRNHYLNELRASEFSDQSRKRNHRQRYRRARRNEYEANKVRAKTRWLIDSRLESK